MGTAVYLLASALPILLLGARALFLRRLSNAARLGLDLILLVASMPIAIKLIGQVLRFPDNIGDHSPGIGVAFVPVCLAALACGFVWLCRLGWFVVRKGQLHARSFPGEGRAPD